MGASAEFLREQRIKLCLSQEALAEAVGVSPRSVNRWEQGRASPQPAYRLRLAQLFGIDSGAITRPLPGQPERAPDQASLWHVPLRRNAFALPCLRPYRWLPTLRNESTYDPTVGVRRNQSWHGSTANTSTAGLGVS